MSLFRTSSMRSAFIAALVVLSSAPVSAQIVACPAQQDSLFVMPQIKSDSGKLRATLRLSDTMRTLWGNGAAVGVPADPRCASQRIRFLSGNKAGDKTPWPVTNAPIPGPTFRARLGDLVEISFFNQINVNNFASTLDKGDAGTSSVCDQYTNQSGGQTSHGAAGGDNMPNCLHGSSTTNVHFHGTHTTPSTTGDNVLLFIRPALRTNGKLRAADELRANLAFQSVFKNCEANGPPKLWTQLPATWQSAQRTLLKEYDATAPYQGQPGKLPASSKLWPYDSAQIAVGSWPQYQIGANPYCFPLPKFDSTTMRMGQSPGTHWYHAHKHGSTALNVANGLTGAFIIAGEYDDTLHAYYGPNFREQVLVVQQLGTAPFPLTTPGSANAGPGSLGRPVMSVNGRINPVIGMTRGEVQMWRIINAAFRDAINVSWFIPQSTASCGTTPPPQTLQWRQIAQDGVQFALKSYQTVGTANGSFNLAPANRADLLVQAPTTAGNYKLCVIRNSAVYVQPGKPGAPDTASVLLSVSVGGTLINPAQQFIPDARFPVQPTFLKDIADSEIRTRRELVFGGGNSTIDGKSFADHQINQAMLLNTAEEWTIKNQANDKAHPFHIHINPFQITAIFEPNSVAATTKGNPCYVDSLNVATFKPCASAQPQAPFVWWDVFAIPSGQTHDISASCGGTGKGTLAACPAPLQPYTACTTAGVCTETIPGWFRMRSRFVDFTGSYVLHCHILIHEDRGMMQLIEVVSDKTPYSHH